MNSDERCDYIRSREEDAEALVSRVRVSGHTPLGTSLKNKVLDPLVSGPPTRAGLLEKHRDMACVCIVQMCVDFTWRSKSAVLLPRSQCDSFCYSATSIHDRMLSQRSWWIEREVQ